MFNADFYELGKFFLLSPLLYIWTTVYTESSWWSKKLLTLGVYSAGAKWFETFHKGADNFLVFILERTKSAKI